MTLSLGIIIFIFGYQLKRTIDELVFQWGNSPPQIARIRIIRQALMRISFTYLLDDIVYNILLPYYEVKLAIYETDRGNDASSLTN